MIKLTDLLKEQEKPEHFGGGEKYQHIWLSN